jgi:EmrB/QacA subfamily drug resistance transporter
MSKENTANKIPKGLLSIAWVLVIGAIAPLLDSTMVNIAINDLTQSMHAELSTVQWVVTGYVLTAAVAVPFSGFFINRFSGKSVYLFAEILFGITSLASALAWNIESLIAFRLLQGFSAGLLMPLLTTLLIDAAAQFKVKSFGELMSIVGLPMILGPVLGPVIGGLIIQYLSWHWIFYINVPVTFIASYLVVKKIPKFPAKNPQARFDFVGVGLLAGLSAFIIYGIVQASTLGEFTNSKTLTFIGVGLVLGLVYLVYAAFKKEAAVLPLSLFKHKSFSGSMAALFFAGTIMNGSMLLLPLFFENLMGLSIVYVGLALLPQGIGMLIARSKIGKLIDQIGARYVTIVSVLITVLATVPFIFFDEQTAFWLILLVLFVRGIGLGGVTMPLMSDAFTGLEASQSAQASIGTRILQNMGGSFGSAFLSTIIAKNMLGKTVTLPHLATSYHAAFLYSVILAVLIFIPAMLLTNKLGKKSQQ